MISCIIGIQILQGFLFCSNEEVFLLGHKFSCFLEIFCEVPLQMMKLVILARLLKTFHQDFWICLLNLRPIRKSLTTVYWWEQVLWKLPSRVGTNQSKRLMALNKFGTQLLLLVVMIFSICDSWCSYHQDLKSNRCWFQFLFLKFGVSRNSGLNWYCGSLVFNLLKTSLNQSKGLLSWIPSFGVSLRSVS